MESGTVEHADAGAKPKRRLIGRKRRPGRKDALLLWLLENEEYDLALLFSKGQYILYYRDGQEYRPKGVSPETMRAAFVEEPVDSGWLSPDIKRCGTGPAGSFVVKYVPPGKHTLQFTAQSPSYPAVVTAPLPGLVFAGVNSGKEGSVATYYVWALGVAEFDPQAGLYHAPLPNVYEDGRICFGENRPPEVARQTIDKAWDLFINSPFTGAMIAGKSKAHGQDVCSQLLALAGLERYPVEDLQTYREERGGFTHTPAVKTVSDVVAKVLLKEDRWS